MLVRDEKDGEWFKTSKQRIGFSHCVGKGIKALPVSGEFANDDKVGLKCPNCKNEQPSFESAFCALVKQQASRVPRDWISCISSSMKIPRGVLVDVLICSHCDAFCQLMCSYVNNRLVYTWIQESNTNPCAPWSSIRASLAGEGISPQVVALVLGFLHPFRGIIPTRVTPPDAYHVKNASDNLTLASFGNPIGCNKCGNEWTEYVRPEIIDAVYIVISRHGKRMRMVGQFNRIGCGDCYVLYSPVLSETGLVSGVEMMLCPKINPNPNCIDGD